MRIIRKVVHLQIICDLSANHMRITRVGLQISRLPAEKILSYGCAHFKLCMGNYFVRILSYVWGIMYTSFWEHELWNLGEQELLQIVLQTILKIRTESFNDVSRRNSITEASFY